jgi:hypothetical protein
MLEYGYIAEILLTLTFNTSQSIEYGTEWKTLDLDIPFIYSGMTNYVISFQFSSKYLATNIHWHYHYVVHLIFLVFFDK